ncbi:hypothetical protein CSUB01_12580, partial [Colletotrichum sublineola]
MWEYSGMLQGLKGAPSTYARFGDLVFGHHVISGKKIPSVMGYLPHLKTSLFIFVDDHNVTSETFEDHFHFLEHHYFPRVAWAPIGLSGSKTFLFDDHANSVGFEIREGRVRPSLKHRTKFAKWKEEYRQKPPKTWEEVQGLLYLTPFVRKYIPGRADLEIKIKQAFFKEENKQTKLGKKSIQREWVPLDTPAWGEEQAKALDDICDAVQKNATHGASSTAQFHLATDSSDFATGAALLQFGDDMPPGTMITDKNFADTVIIMWMSFRLSDQEKRYSVPEKETLAIVRALTECRWLTDASPHPIMLYTDHKSIEQSMRNHGEIHGKLAKWIEQMTEHDVVYVHRPNTTKIIKVADGLSRLHPRLQDDPRPLQNRLACEATVKDRQLVEHNVQHLETTRPGSGHQQSPPANLGDKHAAAEGLKGKTNSSPAINGVIPALNFVSQEQKKALEDELLGSQGLAPWYGDVIAYLLSGPEGIDHLSRDKRRLVRAKAVHYRIQDWQLWKTEHDSSLAKCIGEDQVPSALYEAHDTRGHFGKTATQYHLRGRIFWPKRTQDTDLYIKSCKVCAATGPRLAQATPKKISVHQIIATTVEKYSALTGGRQMA